MDSSVGCIVSKLRARKIYELWLASCIVLPLSNNHISIGLYNVYSSLLFPLIPASLHFRWTELVT